MLLIQLLVLINKKKRKIVLKLVDSRYLGLFQQHFYCVSVALVSILVVDESC